MGNKVASPVASASPDPRMPDIMFVPDLARTLRRTESAIRKALVEGRLGPFGTLAGRKFILRSTLFEHLKTLQVDPNRAPTRGDGRSTSTPAWQ